jgi:hypothetical protein
MNNPSHQADIFDSGEQQRQFVELCNALYERELKHLAQQKDLHRIQSRLASLSYHVSNTAEKLLHADNPLSLDLYNAGWQAKQATKRPVAERDKDKIRQWFKQHARPSLVVTILCEELGLNYYELDSIDKIDLATDRLHCNKFGWFDANSSHKCNAHLRSLT